MTVRIDGMSVDDFVRAAMNGQIGGATVVSGNVFSTSSSYIAEEEIPTREFGKEEIGRVEVEYENLVFDGTTVKLAKTRTCIELKNGAKAEEAEAGGKIKADNCPLLGHLRAGRKVELTNCSFRRANAGGTVKLTNCSFGRANAGGTVKLTNCSFGRANAGGKVELTNCSFGRANAGGKIKADNCKKFEELSAGGKIEIKSSEGNSVSAGGNVDVRESTIHEVLKFSQDSTIADSTVKSIVVLPNSGGVNIINGRIMRSSNSQSTNVYLENTVVENIRFETKGKVFLRGKSEVKGKVINGDVVRTSEVHPSKHTVVVRKTETPTKTPIETSRIPTVAEPGLPLNERKGIFHFFTRGIRIIWQMLWNR
ncbi:MAG: hypothetical protein ACRDDW_06725 [Candidatus Rhabdochlamydia sp.]